MAAGVRSRAVRTGDSTSPDGVQRLLSSYRWGRPGRDRPRAMWRSTWLCRWRAGGGRDRIPEEGEQVPGVQLSTAAAGGLRTGGTWTGRSKYRPAHQVGNAAPGSQWPCPRCPPGAVSPPGAGVPEDPWYSATTTGPGMLERALESSPLSAGLPGMRSLLRQRRTVSCSCGCTGGISPCCHQEPLCGADVDLTPVTQVKGTDWQPKSINRLGQLQRGPEPRVPGLRLGHRGDTAPGGAGAGTGC